MKSTLDKFNYNFFHIFLMFNKLNNSDLSLLEKLTEFFSFYDF